MKAKATILTLGLIAGIFIPVVLALAAVNTNGRGGVMPAYVDGELVDLNFKELPPGSADAVLAQRQAQNVIYQSDDCMPDGEMFISVVDAGDDNVHGLWAAVEIVFDHPAFGCQQLTSVDAIQAAAEDGLITLVPTDTMYRCSIIGPQ